MIQKLVQGVINKKLLVIIIVFMLIVGGIYTYITIPKQNYPSFILPVASVTVVYPGATSEDMEELVTKKVEDTVMTLDGFDNCTSQSKDNVSSVVVSLDLELNQARVSESFNDLRVKMNALKSSLPSGVTQVSVDTDIMDTAGLLVAVTGDKGISGDELSQRTSELQTRLKQIKGVSKTKVYGEQLSEVKITVDSNKLNSLKLSMADLSSVIAAQNSLIPTGNIRVDDQVINVYTSGKFANIEEIKNIIVGASSDIGVLYRLSDIAKVEVCVPDDTPGYTFNKKPCTLLAVYFDEGVNVVSLGNTVRDTLDSFSKTLPAQIKVKEVYFQSDVVKSALHDFGLNVLIAILLVILVVMLGMSIRNALVVCIAIPLAIMTAFLCMPYFNIDVQFVSLAALIVVLGMLVDNSIVINDAIQIRLDNDEDRLSAVKNGTADVAKPVFASMLTAVAGFTSMLTLTGAYKQLAFSLPVVVIICLIASFLISILVTPLMSYFFLKKSNKDKPKRTQKLADAYDKLFQLAFVNKKKTILIAIIFLLVCASSAAFIKLELTAKSNKDVITIEVAGNDENDMGKTRAVVEQIGKILDKQPEVTNYLSGIGIGIPRYEYSVLPKGQGDAVGDIMVRINLDDSKRFKMTKDMVAYLQKDLDSNITGGKAIVDELGIMAFMSKPIEMKLYSDDLGKLNAAADMVSSVMKKTEGTANITDRNAISTYHYYVDMNNNQLNSLGLTKAEVQNELSLALLGRDVSLYRQNGKEYSVFLESNINNLEDLKNFEVKSSTAGYKYSIQQFADVTLTPQLTEIDRINGQRGRTVGCYAAARYSSIAVQKDVEQNLKGIKLPDGVTMEKSGDEKDFQKFVNSILAAALFSFVLILLLLLLQFNSLKKSLMVFISVPFGAAAGVAGLYLTGQHLAMFALLGMISLMGVVMANAIVLIEYIDSERKQGVSISEACRTAGAKRFRPILISTMTAVLGLSPLAVNGDPLFKPMATLLLIGLIVSMIINLIIVPIIYDMVYDKEDPILNQP